MTKAPGKQTVNRRPGGKFAPGNKLGRKFEPGATGNPEGRPKLTLLSEALREQLAQVLPGVDDRTMAEHIARSLIREAIKGNVAAIREIADRTEGKPKQALDVDMNVRDWRQMAQAHGLTEAEIVAEARRLIESVDGSSDA